MLTIDNKRFDNVFAEKIDATVIIDSRLFRNGQETGSSPGYFLTLYDKIRKKEFLDKYRRKNFSCTRTAQIGSPAFRQLAQN